VTVPKLCVVRLVFRPSSVTMTATDSYRIALVEVPWQPAPARTF
jgi:hypothetical protein